MRPTIRSLILATAAVLTIPGAASASAIGDLSQPLGAAACLSASGLSGCGTAVGLGVDFDSGKAADGIAVFDRNPTNGTLVQKAGALGSVSQDTASTPTFALADTRDVKVSADGRALGLVRQIAMSPGGTDIYAAGYADGSVVHLRRSMTTGLLSQTADSSSCYSYDGSESTVSSMCSIGGSAVGLADRLTVSPDGLSLLVTNSNGSLANFDRDAASGVMTLRAG